MLLAIKHRSAIFAHRYINTVNSITQSTDSASGIKALTVLLLGDNNYYNSVLMTLNFVHAPYSQLRHDCHLGAIEQIVSSGSVCEMPGSPATQDLFFLLHPLLVQRVDAGKWVVLSVMKTLTFRRGVEHIKKKFMEHDHYDIDY